MKEIGNILTHAVGIFSVHQSDMKIFAQEKVKVSPMYDPYVVECLLKRTLFLGHWLCEVGWPVPFLTAFISGPEMRSSIKHERLHTRLKNSTGSIIGAPC